MINLFHNYNSKCTYENIYTKYNYELREFDYDKCT